MYFKNKYRIDSVRLKGYDYSSEGLYFVTICTRDKESFFGKILQNEILLSGLGEITDKIWNDIPDQFTNLFLGEYVIMPNHVHGIIGIENDFDRDAINRVSTINRDRVSAINHVSTKQNPGGITGKHNPMLTQNSLGKVIRWFKGRSTFEINKKFPVMEFGWQSRFYDHIIRDQRSLCKIENYILENSENWETHKENL